MLTCHLDPCLGQQYPGRDEKAWKQHQIRHHGPDVVSFTDLGVGQSWHERAIAEVKRLAALGEEFAMWQVFAAVGDPADHKTANGTFATEISHLGLAHVVRYGQSKRPGTKSSACAYWRGGPPPAKETAVA